MFLSKYHIVVNTVLLTIVLSFSAVLNSYGSDPLNAKKLLQKSKYTEALPYYKELYEVYPNDALFQYGYGVCLTETGHTGQLAKKILLQASLNDAPIDVYFYIAKNYHAQSDFETAVKYYERFTATASKKQKKQLKAETMLSACKQKTIPFEPSSEPLPIRPANLISSSTAKEQKTDLHIEIPVQEDTLKPAEAVVSVQLLPTDTISPDQKEQEQIKVQITNTEENVEVHDSEKQLIVPEPDKLIFPDTIINFTITPEITYLKFDQFKTTEGKKSFAEGWKLSQQLIDELTTINHLRTAYERSGDDDQKATIAKQVLDLEQNTISLKQNSDANYLKAVESEMAFWREATEEQIKVLQNQNDSINTINTQKETLVDQTVTANNKTQITEQQEVEIKEEERSEEPAIAENESDEVNIIYRVQIGSYSKGLPDYIDRLYKKLAVLRKIDNYTDEKGITVYTIGELKNFDDAIKLQGQIRQEGVKDAFVVAYNKGKRITLKEARELLKQ